jgi:hypothetical protein
MGPPTLGLQLILAHLADSVWIAQVLGGEVAADGAVYFLVQLQDFRRETRLVKADDLQIAVRR